MIHFCKVVPDIVKLDSACQPAGQAGFIDDEFKQTEFDECTPFLA